MPVAAPRRTVVAAEWLLSPSGEWLSEMALAIEEGTIHALASAADLRAWDGAEHIGGPGFAAVPGLINAHHHGRAASSVALGVPDDTLERWCADLLVSAGADLYDETRYLASKLVAGGVTSVMHVHSTVSATAEGYETELRETLRAYRATGLRAVVVADLRDQGVPVFADERRFLAELPATARAALARMLTPPPPLAGMLEVIARIQAELERETNADLSLAFGPVAQQWCSDELLRSVANAAAGHGLRVQTHLLQTPVDRQLARERWAGGVVREFDALGLLGPRLSCAHAVLLDDADMALLAQRGASVVVSPSSCLRVLRAMADVSRLLSHGVNVALGTDSMSFAAREEMFDEARLLQGLHAFAGADEPVPSATAVRMLTEGGAAVLGRAGVGRLTPGASADVVLVDLREGAPAVGRVAVSDVILSVGSSATISDVIARGRPLVRDGVCLIPAPFPTYSEPAPEMVALVDRMRPLIRRHYDGWTAAHRQV